MPREFFTWDRCAHIVGIFGAVFFFFWFDPPISWSFRNNYLAEGIVLLGYGVSYVAVRLIEMACDAINKKNQDEWD